MLFRETVAVYCENRTEHTNAFCGQNAEFWYVKRGGTYDYVNHWTFKGRFFGKYVWKLNHNAVNSDKPMDYIHNLSMYVYK
jgi:hypothetical protein